MSASSRTSTSSVTPSKAEVRASLADLRSSGGAFEWYEAAAVAQGICRAINESRDPVTKAELALNEVFVDPDGTISISSRPDPAGALPAVRKLLFEMLPPTALAQAKLLPESSLKEFSRALESYERADRVEVIKDIRGRWHPSSVPTFDQLLGRDTTQKAEAETKAADQRRRMPRVLALAVVAGAAVALAVWALRIPHLEAKIRTYTAAISPESKPTVPDDAPSLPSDKPAPIEPAPTPIVRARPARSESAARPRPDVPVAGVTDRVAIPRVVPGPARPEPVSSNQPGPPATPPTAPTMPNAAPVNTAVSTEVFDVTQRDVVPPSFLDAGSTTRPATDAGQQDAAAIEVMVNERGTIDAVKARNSPRSLAASMQMMTDLSAAKNWRFRPAMRDGHPVKYRLVVPIAIH